VVTVNVFGQAPRLAEVSMELAVEEYIAKGEFVARVGFEQDIPGRDAQVVAGFFLNDMDLQEDKIASKRITAALLEYRATGLVVACVAHCMLYRREDVEAARQEVRQAIKDNNTPDGAVPAILVYYETAAACEVWACPIPDGRPIKNDDILEVWQLPFGDGLNIGGYFDILRQRLQQS
jgi:hypothetical protein